MDQETKNVIIATILSIVIITMVFTISELIK